MEQDLRLLRQSSWRKLSLIEEVYKSEAATNTGKCTPNEHLRLGDLRKLGRDTAITRSVRLRPRWRCTIQWSATSEGGADD